MTKRTLTLAAMLLAAVGCSSSSSTPPGDGGKDTTGDKATSDKPNSDTAGDVATSEVATDAGAGDAAADASTDGVALTPLQARGQYLVNVVIGCPDCHTVHKMDGSLDMTKFLAGNPDFVVIGTDKLPSRNLTNDSTGLKNRTDAEIKDMFQNGKRPLSTGTGTEGLNPIMPYYVFHNMKSEDADAIVAYLRTVPGVKNEIPRRSAKFDLSAPTNYLDPNKIPLPLATYPQIESALRGRYLAAESGLCVECHTTKLPPGPDVLDATKLFQGGEDFSPFFAATLMIHPVSKNLTSDTTTGLGTWTTADIVKVLKQGKDKDGKGICPPMPVGPNGGYGLLTDGDALDIANYIKSLPPAVNMVPDMCSFPPMPPPSDGGTDGASTEGGSEAGGSDAGSDAVGN
jgi:mono/diheme cytochrome c family protein